MTTAEIAEGRALVEDCRSFVGITDTIRPKSATHYLLNFCTHLGCSLNQIEADAATIADMRAEVKRLSNALQPAIRAALEGGT